MKQFCFQFAALVIFALASCASAASVSSVHFSKDGAHVDYSINHKAAPWEPSTFVSVQRDGPAVIAPVPAPVAVQAAPVVVAAPHHVVAPAVPHVVPQHVPVAVRYVAPHYGAIADPFYGGLVNPFVLAPHGNALVLA